MARLADSHRLRPGGDGSTPVVFFDTSDDSVTGPIGEDNGGVDGTWSPGETATFRIDDAACALDPGNEILVRVRHTPTEAVLTQQRLTAESA